MFVFWQCGINSSAFSTRMKLGALMESVVCSLCCSGLPGLWWCHHSFEKIFSFSCVGGLWGCCGGASFGRRFKAEVWLLSLSRWAMLSAFCSAFWEFLKGAELAVHCSDLGSGTSRQCPPAVHSVGRGGSLNHILYQKLLKTKTFSFRLNKDFEENLFFI